MNLTNENNKISYSESWLEVTNILKKELGDSIYNSWIINLSFVRVEGSELILQSPSRFIKEWISSNYLSRIKELYQERHINIYSIDIEVNKQVKKKTQEVSKDTEFETNKILNINNNLSSPLDSRFTFENYVVGDANRLAFSAAKFVAENDKVVPGYNPLYLHGGVGLGKTHLMHAIALHIKENKPLRKVIYLSAEKFMYQFVKSLRNNDVMNFKESFREVDLLMIDDIQFICNKESTQEEFFHTLNAVLDANKQIVISGDRSPSELEGMKDRVKSRLGWGMVADISPTDFDLRFGILKSKLKYSPKVRVSDSVLEFLSSKVKSNVRELEGALNKLIAHSSLTNREITVNSTKEILNDLIRSNEKTITILQIQKNVAKYHGIKMSDMSSSCRVRSIARPRQIAMYLCKELTTRSLSEIGIKFGKKDHTTVMHAIKKIKSLIVEDAELSSDIKKLKNIVQEN